MAIIRQGNFLSQQRVDVPDLRSIESGVANDFDALAGKILVGKQPTVVRGWTISTTNTRGNPADQLQLAPAGGIILHYGASESGTVYTASDTASPETLAATNSKVTGSFTAGIVNYVGIDLRRTADATTVDSTKFLDADTEEETSVTVPKARTLDFRIIISTQPFSITSNVMPVAKVLTDASNNVLSVTDARKLMFRLGSGGDNPDAAVGYTFTDDDRAENPITFDISSSADPFAGGDKEIRSMKEWMDAVMTMIWEVKSGPYWYSPTARDNIKTIFTSSVLSTNADNFDYIAGKLYWKGVKIAFENSPEYQNTVQDDDVTGQIFSDGDCLYVDIQRDSVATLVPVVAPLTSLGTPTQPGSRFILAWCLGSPAYVFVRDKGYEIGRAAVVATTTTLGIVKLSVAPLSALSPIAISVGTDGAGANTATGSGFGLIGYGSSTAGSKGILGVAGGTGSLGSYSSAASSNNGIIGVGRGNDAGIQGFGGDGGTGIVGNGGATAGYGVVGNGGPSSEGVIGNGGSGAPGVSGIGGTGGVGGLFAGNGANAGVDASGGSTGPGVYGTGGGTSGTGVIGAGVGTGATGVAGTGGATSGVGVTGQGTGSGAGVTGTGGASGNGVTGVSTASSGVGVHGTGGSSGKGVRGTSADTGVEGVSTGSGTGVYGQASGATGIGVWGVGGTGGVGGLFARGSGDGTGATEDAVQIAQNLYLAGGNPVAATSFTNRLTKMNLPKAWGTISISGGSITLVSGATVGFNYTLGSLGSDLPVIFGGDMASGNYAIMISGYTNTGLDTTICVHPSSKATTGFTITKQGGDLSAGGTTVTIDFFVFGAQ